MQASQSLRPLISDDSNEVIVYGADNFPQYPLRDCAVKSKCDRALAAARGNDLVILRGHVDREYQAWLKSLDLGSDYVVEYKQPSMGDTLSQLIIDNPKPIRAILDHLKKKPVYVPWFSTQQETAAAKVMGGDLFGARESETLRHNDKAMFKALCRQLDIPTVAGAVLEIHADDRANLHEFERLVGCHRHRNGTVIIRGTLGESGMSLYKTTGNDLPGIYQRIVAAGEKTVLIEPFLDVIASPNDQWVVDRTGQICHVGMTDQLCENGMVHIGNTHGLKIPPLMYDSIVEMSSGIVNNMARSGYCGVIGIDFIVTGEGIFPVENNARFNGSSYVNIIVDNIEEKTGAIPFWKFMKLHLQPCTFQQLRSRLASVLYDGHRRNSIFPVNCEDLAESGTCAVVIMGQDTAAIAELENALKILPRPRPVTRTSTATRQQVSVSA